MKFFLTFYLFSLTLFLYSQNILIKPQVFDFGIVHENSGVKQAIFEIENLTNKIYKLLKIQLTCGCTNAHLSNDSLISKSKQKVIVEYDPKNRPGKFFKQIDLIFLSTNVDTLAVSFYIKGNVISNSIVEYNPIDLKNAEIKIPELNYCNNSNELNDFLNDLTYVIDKDEFANISIEHSFFNGDTIQKREFNKLKRSIRDGIIQRGYKPYQIGIKEIESVKPIGCFNISVKGYSSSLNSSTEIKLIKTLNNYFNNNERCDFTVSHEFLWNAKPEKIKLSGEIASKWKYEIIKRVLANEKINLLLTYGFINAEKNETDFSRLHKYVVEKIISAFDDEGINCSLINFVEPVFQIAGNKNEFLKIGMLFENYNFGEENIRFKNYMDSLQLISKIVYHESNYLNNIPVYYQRIEFENSLDTTNDKFRQWMNLIRDKLSTGAKLKFIIEATASNSPTTKNYDNLFVARRRMNESINIFTQALQKNGINTNENVLFKENLALIKGPIYNDKDFLHQHFRKYQYVKIIPVEEDTFVNEQKRITPYFVSFNTNDFELPKKSVILDKFVEHIVQEIKRKGYVKLIIESSASKIPTTEFVSNRVLAFERLQKAKDELMKRVAEYDVNPLRIIFTEEKILVQGPKFNAKLAKETYESFQYVKIIPLINLE